MNDILVSIIKAVLITLVTTTTAIAVEKIRRHNEERNECQYQPGFDEYEHW